jgi:putative pyoverdin transport system ATP-binding/permease protein
MKALLFFMRQSRSTVVSAIVAGVLSGATSVALIALIHRAMAGDAPLVALGRAFAVLCVVQVLSQIASEVLLLRLVEGSIFDLRLRMGRRILAAPLRQLEEIGPHRLLATIAGDVRSVADAVSLSPLIFMNAAILIGCLVYMAMLSVPVFLGVFAFIFMVTAVYQLATRRGARYLYAAREASDDLYSGLRGLTEGTKELKLHDERERAFVAQLLERPADAFRRANVRGMATFRVAGAFGRIMFLVLIGLLLFTLPGLIDVDLHVVQGFVLVILYMLMPMTALLSSLPTLTSAGVALRKVERLGLSLVDEEGSERPSLTRAEVDRWQSVELMAATHAYHQDGGEDEFQLGPVDLRIRPGELVFVIGGNGSGKTTLAKLLVGLYSPEQGEIRLDGATVGKGDLAAYREHFSMVFTDFYLFDELLGLDDPELDRRARQYLEKLQLDHKLGVRDGRLSTTDLSQGQRKRLALLTAYLEDRPIYVFDEWAADQDPVFKRVFYYDLLPELRSRGKTVIVISHDDHYYDVADRLIKLNFGQIEYDSALQPRSAEVIAEGETRRVDLA